MTLVVLLLVGGILVFRHGGGGGGAPGANPTINNGDGSPPPNLFDVKPGPAIEASDKEWAVCANSNFEYWFEYPTAWRLSIPPALTPPGAPRMLESPTSPGVAIVVVPFGLYGSDATTEVAKAEVSYLGNFTVAPGSEKRSQINGRDAIRREYVCRVPTAAGFDERRALGVIVTSRNMGYGIFLRGDEKGVKAAMGTFEKVAATFHVEKMPLRASGVAAPPSNVAAPPSGMAAPPSGLPAEGATPVASGVPAESASASPATSASAVPSALPETTSSSVPDLKSSPATSGSPRSR